LPGDGGDEVLMPVLLIFLFPVAEIYLLIRLGDLYGFVNVLLMMLTTGALGLGVMVLQGKSVVRDAQKSFARGQVPGNIILHRGLIFMGGFLLFLPGVMTDILGICLILPGIRHLLAVYVRVMLARGMARGSIRFFSAGGAAGFSSGSLRPERDAQVIDVEALETSSRTIE
jgi:UPF0716 protein FxsA